jgi:hypothetical protein
MNNRIAMLYTSRGGLVDRQLNTIEERTGFRWNPGPDLNKVAR